MTEGAYFATVAQGEVFKSLDVEEYEIVATLDSRTSEICQDLDGKHFSMSQFEAGVTAPPFHPWCRTATCPYFADEDGAGERFARGADGKGYYVPANMKYKEWKKSFVDGGDKIGLTKAEVGGKMGIQRDGADVLEQPRWKDGETPGGFLNVSVDDVPLDLPVEAKRNILRACNECSLMGYKNDREYATLLDARTGEVVNGHRLLEGVRDQVDVSAWRETLDSAEPLSLISVHDHTNAAPFSFGDIEWFIGKSAVQTTVVTAGSCAYSLTKLSPDHGNYEMFINQSRRLLMAIT
jgi:hypothetical protein